MKFKKFMALGLVAAMTATLFAGCGSKGSDSADGTQKADSASSDGLVSYSDIVIVALKSFPVSPNTMSE